jgi:hypothetical protein
MRKSQVGELRRKKDSRLTWELNLGRCEDQEKSQQRSRSLTGRKFHSFFPFWWPSSRRTTSSVFVYAESI